MSEASTLSARARPASRSRRVWTWAAVVIIVAGASTYVAVRELTSKGTVLCIGDSLTWESASALRGELDAKGFTPQIQAVPGSGLLDTQINWSARAQLFIARYKPKIVVAEFVGDYGLFGTPPGLFDGTPTFLADWAVRAQDLENILGAQGAQVYWVVGPPLENPASEDKLVQLDQIYARLKAPPGSTKKPLLIDTTKVFGTSTGGYTPSVTVSGGGQPVTVRLPDGTHFTPAGTSLFAQTISNAL
jgi:hypothetical protein